MTWVTGTEWFMTRLILVIIRESCIQNKLTATASYSNNTPGIWLALNDGEIAPMSDATEIMLTVVEN
ncbi:MAG: hypothetical protein HKL80_04060 [Acidimicrobiales bacterium]|nr:hypothetical protein [Acidimicrobiales bacterium]